MVSPGHLTLGRRHRETRPRGTQQWLPHQNTHFLRPAFKTLLYRFPLQASLKTSSSTKFYFLVNLLGAGPLSSTNSRSVGSRDLRLQASSCTDRRNIGTTDKKSCLRCCSMFWCPTNSAAYWQIYFQLNVNSRYINLFLGSDTDNPHPLEGLLNLHIHRHSLELSNKWSIFDTGAAHFLNCSLIASIFLKEPE